MSLLSSRALVSKIEGRTAVIFRGDRGRRAKCNVVAPEINKGKGSRHSAAARREIILDLLLRSTIWPRLLSVKWLIIEEEYSNRKYLDRDVEIFGKRYSRLVSVKEFRTQSVEEYSSHGKIHIIYKHCCLFQVLEEFIYLQICKFINIKIVLSFNIYNISTNNII